jgi:translocation and assembly module TamB
VHGKLTLARGQFELNGRDFEVHRGTITFQPDEPDNPLVVLDARWYSPEGITVIASFTGPVKSGTLSLSSDPALREDQVVSLLLFGDTSGLGEGAVSGDANSSNQAAVVGGSLASSGLNQALGRFKAVDLSTRVRGEEGNVRPEVVVQLTNSLSAQLGYNLEEPSPGKSPDRTLLTFEARLVGGSSISATVGDQGSSLVNWVWRYRY